MIKKLVGKRVEEMGGVIKGIHEGRGEKVFRSMVPTPAVYRARLVKQMSEVGYVG